MDFKMLQMLLMHKDISAEFGKLVCFSVRFLCITRVSGLVFRKTTKKILKVANKPVLQVSFV